MSKLPTIKEMFAQAQASLRKARKLHTAGQLDAARNAYSDARDWLKSDWTPGACLTKAQVNRRKNMFAEITVAKAAIDEAKGMTA